MHSIRLRLLGIYNCNSVNLYPLCLPLSSSIINSSYLPWHPITELIHRTLILNLKIPEQVSDLLYKYTIHPYIFLYKRIKDETSISQILPMVAIEVICILTLSSLKLPISPPTLYFTTNSLDYFMIF